MSSRRGSRLPIQVRDSNGTGSTPREVTARRAMAQAAIGATEVHRRAMASTGSRALLRRRLEMTDSAGVQMAKAATAAESRISVIHGRTECAPKHPHDVLP